MSIIFLSNHSATDKLCVTFYKFYNAFMIFSQFITYTSTLYDLQSFQRNLYRFNAFTVNGCR